MNTIKLVKHFIAVAILLFSVDGFAQVQDSVQHKKVIKSNPYIIYGRRGVVIPQRSDKDSKSNDKANTRAIMMPGMIHRVDTTKIVKPPKKH